MAIFNSHSSDLQMYRQEVGDCNCTVLEINSKEGYSEHFKK